MTGQILGTTLSQIFVNLNSQTYQVSSLSTSPTMEFTCPDDKIAHICYTIFDNVILCSSRAHFEYRVWNELNKLYLISNRDEDHVGDAVDKNYIIELSSKIIKYLSCIIYQWEMNDSLEGVTLLEKLSGSNDADLHKVFEHDEVGYDMSKFLSHFFLEIDQCYFSFSKTINKKVILCCSQENLNKVTNILVDTITAFTERPTENAKNKNNNNN